MRSVPIQPLTKEAFEPFGEVIEKAGSQNFAINRGNCFRHHALATADIIGEDAEVIVSIFSGQPYDLPLVLDLVERHPLGSQAFYPLGSHDWLVTVCVDDNGVPLEPQAFLASPDQGVNFNKNQWHGVLTPMLEASDFLVIDRAGPGDNLEEHFFTEPWIIGK